MRMVMSVRIPFTRLVTTLTRFLAFALLLVPGILLRELLVTVRRVVVVLAAVDARRTRTGLRFGNLVRLTNRRSTQRVLELQLGLYLVQLQLSLGCSVENGGDGRSIGLRHLREEPVNLDVVSEGVGAGRSQLFHKTNESLDLVDDRLGLEVEDLDARRGGRAQPVAVGGEDEGVDLVTGGERVEVLGLVQVPEHGGTVLATRGAEGSVGGDGDGVDVASVADVVSLELAGGEFPDLEGDA